MRALRRALLAWYDEHRRDLPWRRTRDPYAIWISEAMLQQTRVETVIPYYERFLARFPNVETLATAEQDDVLGLWAGLGYYSRARNLHRAAQKVADEHGGVLPDDAAGLRKLPGVGRYTAGAVASIAFDKPEPVVDGNVVRVLSRVLGVREDVGAKSVIDHLWVQAGALARGPRPGDLNQALMELGATLCTPRAPRCLVCPLEGHCDAKRRGDAEELPRKGTRSAPRKVAAVVAELRRGSRLLAVRRPEGGLLGGLWDLPGGALAPGEAPAAGLTRTLDEQLALHIEQPRCVGSVGHVFTHRHLELHVFRAAASRGRVRRRGFDAHRWVSPAGLAELPVATVTEKALALLREHA